MRSWRSVGPIAAMIVLGVTAGLVLGEFALRIVSPLPDRVPALYAYDPELGWRLQPGIRYSGRSPSGERVAISINTAGYRGPLPSAKKRGTRRVVILGDSFTEALGVPYESSYPALMGPLLNKAGQPTEVVALGTSSYGTVHEYLVCKRQAVGLEPDLVVLQMCWNDFWDNTRGLSYQGRGPWAALSPEGRVEVIPPTTGRDSEMANATSSWQRVASWLKWNSAIGFRLARLLEGRATGGAAYARNNSGRKDAIDPRHDGRLALAKQLTCLLLREMRDICRGSRARFAVYINPSTLPVGGKPLIYEANLRTEDFVLDPEIERWLLADVLQFCQREGLECVWSRDLFEPARRSGLQVTPPDDPHWNSVGHRLVAQDLAQHVAQWLEEPLEGPEKPVPATPPQKRP